MKEEKERALTTLSLCMCVSLSPSLRPVIRAVFCRAPCIPLLQLNVGRQLPHAVARDHVGKHLAPAAGLDNLDPLAT